MMKLISWNVNGLRSVLKKGFVDFLKGYDPDVLCVQETKAPGEPIAVDVPGYQVFWNHAQKPGYSGTAVFSKMKPVGVANGIGTPKHDKEGRVITAEFGDLYLVNVYVPNSKRELTRLPYRTKEWDVDFLKYLKKLEKKKPVVFCGDLNVAYAEIDLANPASNRKNHGFTDEERLGFTNLLNAGFLDTFREFTKEGGHYSWWSPLGTCRQRNVGWRIDYFLVSKALRPKLKKAFILPEYTGSDHCPVGIEMAD